MPIVVRWRCHVCAEEIVFEVDADDALDPIRLRNHVVRTVNMHLLSHENGHTP